MRSVKRKIAKIGVIAPSWRKYGCAFFRSENSKRSKEIKLCIVYAHTHTHSPSVSSHLHMIRICKEFRSDFEREAAHFSRGATSRASSCKLQRANFQHESHVTMYIHTYRVVCTAWESLVIVTWWKRKLVCSFTFSTRFYRFFFYTALAADIETHLKIRWYVEY